MRTGLLADAATALAAAGCETPRLDAELLLAEAAGTDRLALLTRDRPALSADQAARFHALVARRARREPVAYIVGQRAFRDLEVAVDARVLVPRPETELLVETALDLPRGARVLDVGTGSGAVALALKHERPDLDVAGSDVSADALAVARANAQRLGLAVQWIRADLLDGAGAGWDAVVANLPYVAAGERPALAPEITHHEPHVAVFAGDDPLALIGRLARQLGDAAVPWAALEIGLGQADAVRGRLAEAGYATAEWRCSRPTPCTGWPATPIPARRWRASTRSRAGGRTSRRR